MPADEITNLLYDPQRPEAGGLQAGETEAWTLTCERRGDVKSTQQVFVDRGERKSVILKRGCPRNSRREGRRG